MAEKYVIFKKEDFEEYEAQVLNSAPSVLDGTGLENEKALKRLREVAVPDGVVIRRQDIGSPPAFDAYSNAFRMAVEILKSDNGGYNSKTVEELQSKADYFHEQASLAWLADRKIPD